MEYQQNSWVTGDRITATKLTAMESGISNNDHRIDTLASNTVSKSDLAENIATVAEIKTYLGIT